MIIYESAKFHPRYVFQRRGSVFPFSMMIAVPNAVIAIVLKVFAIRYLSDGWEILGLNGDSDSIAGAAYSGVTFLLGFMIVFRTQQAYARFWEGTTAIHQMQGEWFDAASSLVAFCKMSNADKNAVVLFQHLAVRLFSMLSAVALMELSTPLCSDGSEVTERAFELELIDAEGIDMQSLVAINETEKKVELIFQWIQQLVVESDYKELFSVAPPILSRVFNEMANGMVRYHDALKIAKVPLPFPYMQATELMLMLHWLVTPPLMCVWVVSPLWTGVLSFIQICFFWSLNSIASELENPYGDDVNDLPAEELQSEMNKKLLLLLRPGTCRTAKLSPKAALEEVEMEAQVLAENSQATRSAGRKVTMGQTVALGRTGLNTGMPAQAVYNNRISLGCLQESIQRKASLAEGYDSEMDDELEFMVAADKEKNGTAPAYGIEIAATVSHKSVPDTNGRGNAESHRTAGNLYISERSLVHSEASVDRPAGRRLSTRKGGRDEGWERRQPGRQGHHGNGYHEDSHAHHRQEPALAVEVARGGQEPASGTASEVHVHQDVRIGPEHPLSQAGEAVSKSVQELVSLCREMRDRIKVGLPEKGPDKARGTSADSPPPALGPALATDSGSYVPAMPTPIHRRPGKPLTGACAGC